MVFHGRRAGFAARNAHQNFEFHTYYSFDYNLKFRVVRSWLGLRLFPLCVSAASGKTPQLGRLSSWEDPVGPVCFITEAVTVRWVPGSVTAVPVPALATRSGWALRRQRMWLRSFKFRSLAQRLRGSAWGGLNLHSVQGLGIIHPAWLVSPAS